MTSTPSGDDAGGNPAAEAGTAPAPGTDWQVLEGLDPATATFPARARLDGETIVVLRTKTGYRGVERRCPHMQATMMNAELAANDTMVRCPLHVFTFKLSDGKGVNCPGFRIKVYEVKAENGVLLGRRLG